MSEAIDRLRDHPAADLGPHDERTAERWPALSAFIDQLAALELPPEDTPRDDPRWYLAVVPTPPPDTLTDARTVVSEPTPADPLEAGAHAVTAWWAHLTLGLAR